MTEPLKTQAKRLVGKRAIVTGGGSGIGRGAAIRFAEEGAEVLIAGRTAENIEETAAMIRALGGKAHIFVVDLIVEDQAPRSPLARSIRWAVTRSFSRMPATAIGQCHSSSRPSSNGTMPGAVTC